MSDAITFWYGCNVVRHGDIIHAAVELLKAVGYEVDAVGGAGYCCGTTKDANLRAAEGMGRRTVEKFNAKGRDVVTWCPSCHRHMGSFVSRYTRPLFDVAHFPQMLAERLDRLAPLLVRPIERRVMLHRHVGFREVDVDLLVERLLRAIPGLELVPSRASHPGHMCSALAAIPEALRDATRSTIDEARALGADTVATVYHSCQRLICGVEADESFTVENYATLLARSMGLDTVDEYTQWKLAGSAEAVRERVGAERIEQVGRSFFEQSILPELVRKPLR